MGRGWPRRQRDVQQAHLPARANAPLSHQHSKTFICSLLTTRTLVDGIQVDPALAQQEEGLDVEVEEVVSQQQAAAYDKDGQVSGLPRIHCAYGMLREAGE